MARWCGKIAYASTVETSPGIWENPKMIIRTYRGDLIRDTVKIRDSDKVNGDISIANKISVVADPFARLNFHHIEYVTFGGASWKVSNIEFEYPRMILSLGEAYADAR